MRLKALFFDHPASVGQTYWQHFGSASWFAYALSKAALAVSAHALLPCLFEKTASRIVSGLYQRMVVAQEKRR
ncbi:MAG TPA: DUF6356 family protein [Usitatibacter sp.]|nr:DUF6356 family protein [Usitatibacter sp.]